MAAALVKNLSLHFSLVWGLRVSLAKKDSNSCSLCVRTPAVRVCARERDFIFILYGHNIEHKMDQVVTLKCAILRFIPCCKRPCHTPPET